MIIAGDPVYDTSKVQKVVLCSGKHYYSLAAKRENLRNTDTALIRIESFCPFPTMQIQAELAKFPNAKSKSYILCIQGWLHRIYFKFGISS